MRETVQNQTQEPVKLKLSNTAKLKQSISSAANCHLNIVSFFSPQSVWTSSTTAAVYRIRPRTENTASPFTWKIFLIHNVANKNGWTTKADIWTTTGQTPRLTPMWWSNLLSGAATIFNKQSNAKGANDPSQHGSGHTVRYSTEHMITQIVAGDVNIQSSCN